MVFTLIDPGAIASLTEVVDTLTTPSEGDGAPAGSVSFGQTYETTAILRLLAAAGVTLSPLAVDRPWPINSTGAGTLILAEGYLLVAGLVDAQLTHLARTAQITEAIHVLSQRPGFELRPGNPAYFTLPSNLLDELSTVTNSGGSGSPIVRNAGLPSGSGNHPSP